MSPLERGITPIFAHGSGDIIFPIFVLGPIFLACLIMALAGGMSRNAKKRRQSGKFLLAGVIALLLMVLVLVTEAKS
jgi:hypothetical protein